MDTLFAEKVVSPGSQHTAVILDLRRVTLVVCGFGELVFVMARTFVPLTKIRNDKTEWMNFLLEKVESPGSQRTAVILVLRGVTLLVCGIGQLVIVMSQTFLPLTETRNDKPKWIHFMLRRWSRLDLSVQGSFWFCVESRWWCVVLASWFS